MRRVTNFPYTGKNIMRISLNTEMFLGVDIKLTKFQPVVSIQCEKYEERSG